MNYTNDSGSALSKRLRTFFPLSNEAEHVLSRTPIQISSFPSQASITHQGGNSGHSCLILEGIAAFEKILPSGDRQIMSLHLKGDIPDLHSVYLKTLDSGLQALSPCTVGLIPHSVVKDLCSRHHEIAAAFWKMTLVDSAIYREWIANVGRRDALGRMSHLLCETFLRLKVIGETVGLTCHFPITQVDLADATGMTPVHVNRTITSLRTRKLIEIDRRRLHILDWEALVEVAGFEPDYLHLEDTTPQADVLFQPTQQFAKH